MERSTMERSRERSTNRPTKDSIMRTERRGRYSLQKYQIMCIDRPSMCKSVVFPQLPCL
jgi:hypothetical protein